MSFYSINCVVSLRTCFDALFGGNSAGKLCLDDAEASSLLLLPCLCTAYVVVVDVVSVVEEVVVVVVVVAVAVVLVVVVVVGGVVFFVLLQYQLRCKLAHMRRCTFWWQPCWQVASR